MSDLRDARLQKALASAPDAQLRPDARTRQAIRARARDAIAPAAAPTWWQKFRSGPGAPQRPWSAVFATLAVATLVTVLWHEREIPGARPESAQSDQPAPAAPAQPAASVSHEAPATAAPAPARTAPPPAPRQARKAAPAVSQSGTFLGRSQPAADAARERNVDSAAGALRDQDTRALAKSTPQRADAAGQAETASTASAAPPPQPSSPIPAPAAAAAAAPAAPAAPDAAPSAAPAAAARAAAPAGLASQSQPSPSPVDGATQLRVASGARSVEAPLEHPSRLADLMSRVARDARSPEPLEAPVDLRVELRRQGELAGVMELAGSQARWTSWRAGESHSATTRPDVALLQALREEFNRLLER